jgi:hypothetical protein
MAWENPTKMVRLCFFKTGWTKEHFALVADDDAAERLITFLQESDAVIVELENYSAEEIELLKKAKGRAGRSLFAVPGCFRGGPGLKAYCDRTCT